MTNYQDYAQVHKFYIFYIFVIITFLALDNLSERVDIHMEKVARREVGQLTARKPITKQQTVLSPANPGTIINMIIYLKIVRHYLWCIGY